MLEFYQHADGSTGLFTICATSRFEMDSRKRTLKELVEVCLVPGLVRDVEDYPIHPDSFQEFRKSLEINLPLLLDHLSSQDVLLELDEDDDCDIKQLRLQFIMLMCEQAPNGQPFRLNSDLVWNGLEARSNPYVTAELLTKGLERYKEQLIDGKWKRNLGPAFGFAHFAELHLREIKPDLEITMFLLSIASQFIECIHAEIKQLALMLYHLILSQCPKKLILEANVNKVIISICLQNSQKLLKDECLISLWVNVKSAILMDDRITSDYNWNELDDGLQLLFQRIKLEGDRRARESMRNILLEIIMRCCREPVGLREIRHSNLEDHRSAENVKLFRWIADLKELYIFECLSISNCVESTLNSLQVSLIYRGSAFQALSKCSQLPTSVYHSIVYECNLRPPIPLDWSAFGGSG